MHIRIFRDAKIQMHVIANGTSNALFIRPGNPENLVENRGLNR
jgi:hypothetical protein